MEYRKLPGDPSLADSFAWKELLDCTDNPERLDIATEMEALRSKSVRLTGYLQAWLDRAGRRRVRTITPREEAARGCQLSLQVLERPQELFGALRDAGVVGDFRPPDVVRVAPVPLYNSFHDIWRFGQALTAWSGT